MCIYICIRIDLFDCLFLLLYVDIYIYIYTHIHLHTYIYIHTRAYLCTRTYIHTYIHTYILVEEGLGRKLGRAAAEKPSRQADFLRKNMPPAGVLLLILVGWAEELERRSQRRH